MKTSCASNQNRPICSTWTLNQNPLAGHPHTPGTVMTMRVSLATLQGAGEVLLSAIAVQLVASAALAFAAQASPRASGSLWAVLF